jgi:hypothetical protein
MIWLLRRCVLRVLNRGAQADTRPAARVDDRARATYAEATPAMRKVSGARNQGRCSANNRWSLGALEYMTAKIAEYVAI